MSDDRKIYYNSWNEGTGDGQSDDDDKEFGEYCGESCGPFKEGPSVGDGSFNTLYFNDFPYNIC